jgi:hypothetical protein
MNVRVALERAIEERPDPFVDLGAEPRDLALGESAHAHRLHQLVDRAGRHAVHVGFLDHRRQRFRRRPTRLQEPGEVAPPSAAPLRADPDNPSYTTCRGTNPGLQ